MGRKLSFKSAMKRWRHLHDEPCPVTGKDFGDGTIWTDPSRGGYENGKFSIVFFNSCKHCAEPKESMNNVS